MNRVGWCFCRPLKPLIALACKKNLLIDTHPQFSSITESIDSLPLANTPEIFGLHPNAEINYYNQATREIWNHLIELQPQTGEFFFQHRLCISLCSFDMGRFCLILFAVYAGNHRFWV